MAVEDFVFFATGVEKWLTRKVGKNKYVFFSSERKI
jgi:hypothetical protein